MAEQLIQVSDLSQIASVLSTDFIHIKQLSDNGDYKIEVGDFAASISNLLNLAALAYRDTINNDYWVGVDLSVANGGTGASDAATARTNLGIYSKTETDARYLLKANNLNDLANVGTARNNLGLGTLATLSSINDTLWSGTDLSVTNGGTGASTAKGAFDNIKQVATTTYSGTVQLDNTVSSSSTSLAGTANAVKTANDNAETRALKTTSINTGDGLTGGGDLSASRTLSMGTPLTIGRSTTNGFTGSQHSHAIDSSLAFPVGGIIMWSGSIASIPTGWALCNGLNGTPDLRNKFIVGAHSDNGSVANTTITGGSTQAGGDKDAVVVAHGHSASSSTTGSHTHGVQVTQRVTGDDAAGGSRVLTANRNINYSTVTITGMSALANGNHSHTIAVNSIGESGVNKNLPPYYALAFIMKTT